MHILYLDFSTPTRSAAFGKTPSKTCRISIYCEWMFTNAFSPFQTFTLWILIVIIVWSTVAFLLCSQWFWTAPFYLFSFCFSFTLLACSAWSSLYLILPLEFHFNLFFFCLNSTLISLLCLNFTLISLFCLNFTLISLFCLNFTLIACFAWNFCKWNIITKSCVSAILFKGKT